MLPMAARDCSKKCAQQGLSGFRVRSVRLVREHGKRARAPLAVFINSPNKKNSCGAFF